MAPPAAQTYAAEATTAPSAWRRYQGLRAKGETTRPVCSGGGPRSRLYEWITNARVTAMAPTALTAVPFTTRRHNSTVASTIAMVANQGCTMDTGPDLATDHITAAPWRAAKRIAVPRDTLSRRRPGRYTSSHHRSAKANSAK